MKGFSRFNFLRNHVAVFVLWGRVGVGEGVGFKSAEEEQRQRHVDHLGKVSPASGVIVSLPFPNHAHKRGDCLLAGLS